MKLLILSCSTGEGHNSAGKALLEYLEENGVACEMTDTLSLVTSPVSQMVSDVYLFSTRRNLFKTVYRMGETVSTGLSLQSPVYMANKSMRNGCTITSSTTVSIRWSVRIFSRPKP